MGTHVSFGFNRSRRGVATESGARVAPLGPFRPAPCLPQRKKIGLYAIVRPDHRQASSAWLGGDRQPAWR